MNDRLCVVMPVYNEQEAIGDVLKKWTRALDLIGMDYVIRPYNDGSKDGSFAVMNSIAADLPRIQVKDKPNGGHGNTILTGYREAAADGFDWVFQIDSDDEMGPEKFNELWSRRNDYDFLVGIRDGRVQALPRKIISFVSRLCVRIFYGRSVWDVNTPYRLMRVSAFKPFYDVIPLTTFAPNVILSGLAARHKLRCFETRVPQHDRTTGEVSIKKWKLLKAAAKSFRQTIFFAIKDARGVDWLRYCAYGLISGFAALSVIIGVKNGLREFDFQWDPAKLLMMGDNPYLYSLEHKAIPYDGFMEKYIDANQLPSCLLLLAPWTFLPQLLANQVWAFCNLAFTAVFLIFAYKSFFEDDPRGKDSYVLITALLLSGTPWRVLVGNGQHLMFSLAFFMPAYYYGKKGKFALSGLLLALSAFKYTTIVPMAVIFIVRRWWKAIFVAVGIHFVATLGIGIYLDDSPIRLVLQSLKVGATLTGGGLTDIASVMAQFGVVDIGFWANIGYALWSIVLLLLLSLKRFDDLLTLSLLAVISNVMFYHRIYDFVTLFFPVVYIIKTWDSGDLLNKSVKWLTVANVAWAFYIQRILGNLNLCCEILVFWSLQHFLLLALILKNFSAKTTSKLEPCLQEAGLSAIDSNG